MQGQVHVIGRALKEPSAAAQKQGVAGEDGLLRRVRTIIMNDVGETARGVAGTVDGFDPEVAQLERLSVREPVGHCGDSVVKPVNSGLWEQLAQGGIATGMVATLVTAQLWRHGTRDGGWLRYRTGSNWP